MDNRRLQIIRAAEQIADEGFCFDVPEMIEKVEFLLGMRLKSHERVIARNVYDRHLLSIS